LHGVELFGGAGDAAEPGHGGKGEEVGQFHGARRFILEMSTFSSIHF
jgi:hypothetical protein